MRWSLAGTLLLSISLLWSQNKSTPLTSTELVMSMSQRSMVMPGYLTDLKALIARQAYDFWKDNETEPYVSHLNVYRALYQANKFLGYDSAKGLAFNQIGFHTNTITSIVFGTDPDTYYSSATDGKIYKWRLSRPKQIPETVFETDRIIQSLEMSRDGKVLMAIFYKAGLALIPTNRDATGDIQVLEDPQPIQTATFFPGERKYVSLTKEGELLLKAFDASSEKIGETTRKVNKLRVNEQDGTIYAGTDEGTLEAWEKPYLVKDSPIEDIIKNWKNQSYFGYKLGSFAIKSMDISPDGKTIAIGRDRGDIILWDIPNKKLIRIISGHQSTVTDLHFHPDGNLLLTTSRDHTARIWDLTDSRKLPLILDDHNDWVLTGSFDPTGTRVITGGADHYIRSWPVAHRALADRICSMVTRALTQEEWNEFVGADIPFTNTCGKN